MFHSPGRQFAVLLNQSQQLHKGIVMTNKAVTLQLFSTTVVQGFTKMKRHGIRLILIAGPVTHSPLLNSIQCTPTYCNLKPVSNMVSVGLRNISAKKTTIPVKAVICQVHLANMVAKLHALVGKLFTKAGQEDDGSWILEQLDLGELQ